MATLIPMQRLPIATWVLRITLFLSAVMLLAVVLSIGLAGLLSPSLQLAYVHQLQIDGEDFASLMLRDLRLDIDYPLIREYPGWASAAAWSSDGTMIAYSRYKVVGGQRNIYVYHLSDGSQQRISDISTSGGYNSPSWSPDGRFIVYHGTGTRSLDVDLFMYDRQTKQQELLYTGVGSDMMPAWSPDGQTILFLSNTGLEFVPQVYRLDVETGVTRPLTRSSVSYFVPAWSPDGSALAIGAFNGVTHGLDILTLDDAELRVIIRRPRQQITYSEPDWSPDGRWIAYTEFSELGSQIFIIAADGGRPIPLTSTGASYRQPAWRPFRD